MTNWLPIGGIHVLQTYLVSITDDVHVLYLKKLPHNKGSIKRQQVEQLLGSFLQISIRIMNNSREVVIEYTFASRLLSIIIRRLTERGEKMQW
jgi:hypothetical protein